MREAMDELRSSIASGSDDEHQAIIDRYEQLIASCESGTERVGGVVDTLRRLGGGNGGDPRFSLNAAVADAVTLLERRVQDCAQLDLRLGKVPDVEGDPSELSQVVMAVLINAVEAVEKKGTQGTISITTYANANAATLRITDDGVGIDAELLPRICDPFVTTKEGTVGAGLGLHAARQTLESQGGDVRIQSDEGHGASVTVDFALGQPAAQEPVS